MKHTLTQWRSFPPAVQLLMVNQFTINVGFYMLMPYLATHLAGDLGLAVWLVGLVLGVRNLTQQSMFLIGGSLADRFGYKPMIVAGCALRTGLSRSASLGGSMQGVLAGPEEAAGDTSILTYDGLFRAEPELADFLVNVVSGVDGVTAVDCSVKHEVLKLC